MKSKYFSDISPNLTLPVLILIKLPSLLSFLVGKILFIFERQKHCLFYANLIQFDETLYGTLKPVSSNKQLYKTVFTLLRITAAISMPYFVFVQLYQTPH